MEIEKGSQTNGEPRGAGRITNSNSSEIVIRTKEVLETPSNQNTQSLSNY